MFQRRKAQLNRASEAAVEKMGKAEEPGELRRIFHEFLHDLFPGNEIWFFLSSEFPPGQTQEERYMAGQLAEQGLLLEPEEGIFDYTSIEGVRKQAQLTSVDGCLILLEKPVLPPAVKARKKVIKPVLWHMRFIHGFLVRRMEREEAVKSALSRHISQGIHDSLAQQLFFLSAQTFGLKMSVPPELKEKESFMKQLKKLEEAVQEVQTDTRNYIAYLRGDQQEMELQESLREMLSRRLDPRGIHWKFRTKGQVVKEKLQVEETIYHVVEELVSNALKHGKITSLKLDLDVNAVQWEVQLLDDSRNVPKEMVSGEKSYGIEGIRQRLEEVNGDITFQPAAEKGLLVICVIPRGGEG